MVFALATVVSTAIMLAVDIVNARSLLQPFAQYVATRTHDHGTNVPADFLMSSTHADARHQRPWTLLCRVKSLRVVSRGGGRALGRCSA